jgi:hypothetical protein
VDVICDAAQSSLAFFEARDHWSLDRLEGYMARRKNGREPINCSSLLMANGWNGICAVRTDHPEKQRDLTLMVCAMNTNIENDFL